MENFNVDFKIVLQALFECFDSSYNDSDFFDIEDDRIEILDDDEEEGEE